MYPQKCTLKNLKKKHQEKWENAYLRVKNARASRACLKDTTDIGSLCSLDSALLHQQNLRKNFWGPPDQILDRLVQRLLGKTKTECILTLPQKQDQDTTYPTPLPVDKQTLLALVLRTRSVKKKKTT